jgi:hypothetical protein
LSYYGINVCAVVNKINRYSNRMTISRETVKDIVENGELHANMSKIYS